MIDSNDVIVGNTLARFDNLMKKLIAVPKSDVTADRPRKHKAAKPRTKIRSAKPKRS